MSDDRAVRDEVEEFAHIYDRHRARVYGLCLRRLRSAADADDATQTTFLRAFAAVRRGNGPRRIGPWLATIARNECADRLSAPGQTVPMDTSEWDLVDDGPAPEDRVLAESEGEEVRAALVHLPFAQRSVLHLREVEELAYAEIAARLSVPVSAVETLLFRARANLREEVFAARAPLRCEAARVLSEAVRDGVPVTGVERKTLRNHREACHLCAWLPVRRARGIRAAAIMVLAAVTAGGRRLISTPVADAMTAGSAPAKTAAVALTAGSVAAGGLAVEHRAPVSDPARPHAAAVRKAPSRSAAVAPRQATATAAASTSRAASPAPGTTKPASSATAAARTRPAVEVRAGGGDSDATPAPVRRRRSSVERPEPDVSDRPQDESGPTRSPQPRNGGRANPLPPAGGDPGGRPRSQDARTPCPPAGDGQRETASPEGEAAVTTTG